jgi:hypothetical protein
VLHGFPELPVEAVRAGGARLRQRPLRGVSLGDQAAPEDRHILALVSLTECHVRRQRGPAAGVLHLAVVRERHEEPVILGRPRPELGQEAGRVLAALKAVQNVPTWLVRSRYEPGDSAILRIEMAAREVLRIPEVRRRECEFQVRRAQVPSLIGPLLPQPVGHLLDEREVVPVRGKPLFLRAAEHLQEFLPATGQVRVLHPERSVAPGPIHLEGRLRHRDGLLGEATGPPPRLLRSAESCE